MKLPLPWLDPDSVDFPDPASALANPNGLLAVGGDLATGRLLHAYQKGIFPWFEQDQPPLWWSPDPRMVLFPQEFHCSRSLLNQLKGNYFRVTTDQAFAEVVVGCAAPRAGSDGTWITDAMLQAYCKLYESGYAHSLEVWKNDELCGGIYGLTLGSVFYGESMFSKLSNASKTCVAWLVKIMPAYGFTLLDCQIPNPHLQSLGARAIPRQEFMHYLANASISHPPVWPVELPGTYQDLTGLKYSIP